MENTRSESASNVTAGHLFWLPANLIRRRIYVLSGSVVFTIQVPLNSKGHFQGAVQETRSAAHPVTPILSWFYVYFIGLAIPFASVGQAAAWSEDNDSIIALPWRLHTAWKCWCLVLLIMRTENRPIMACVAFLFKSLRLECVQETLCNLDVWIAVIEGT